MPGNAHVTALKVSENQRFLVKEDGQLFFWLADTAWELFHRLNREEADQYLQNREKLKFNVIQAAALSPCNGVTKENAYGKLPLLRNDRGMYDPSLPDLTGDYTYWDHVDYIVSRAEELGLYVAFWPSWGDKIRAQGRGPEIFTKHNARKYGQFIGQRYKDRTNIIWVLGGDRAMQTREHFQIVNEMAEGLKEGDGGRHLISFHPHGGGNSSHHVHDERWLDFNMVQSGHHSLTANYEMISNAYHRQPIKPVLDGEPNYEDIPIAFKVEQGFIDAADVRRSAYWSVLSGACGHSYGHHCVWEMVTEPYLTKVMDWQQGIQRPGAAQMQFLSKLIESRRFMAHFPDQSLIVENYAGANYMQANRCDDCALIYSPCGIFFKVQMGILRGERVEAWWYNPRDGVATFAGDYENKGEQLFRPPGSGRGEDWVLILEDANGNYPVL